MDLKEIAGLTKGEREGYVDELRRMRHHVQTALKNAPAAATSKLVELNLTLLQSIWSVERSLRGEKAFALKDWMAYAEMLEQAIRNYSEEEYRNAILGRPDRTPQEQTGYDMGKPFEPKD